MSVSPTTTTPPPAVADSEAKFGNRLSVTPPTLMHSDFVFSFLSPLSLTVAPCLSAAPFVGTCSDYILHVPQILYPPVYLHSIPCWDLTSCPPPPPLPNSSGMHLRNVLREEEFPGRGMGGHCCCFVKHDGKGSKVLRAEQELDSFSPYFQGPCSVPSSPSVHFSVPFPASPSCSDVGVHSGPAWEEG